MSSSAPAVSVALCTYNGERYVTEQLESIAAQSLPATEVLVFDDASTDATVDRVREFIANYDGPTRFSLESTDRAGGVVPNFERALAACTGEFIALSDQDDVWHPDRLKVAVEHLSTNPHLLLVNADARVVDADGQPTGDSLLGALYVSPEDLAQFHAGHGFQQLIRRNVVTGAATLVRRSLLKDAFPLAPDWVHDEWLAILAAARGGMDTLEQTLIDYRVHGGNQIGVKAPTLKHRLAQLRVPRADRLVKLSRRSTDLVARLERMEVPQEVLDLARRKQHFETKRAAYPRARLLRLGPVLQNAKGGNYAALSSQGTKDILRDIIQPA